jgi:preprotein translocase subunit SecD
MKAPLTLALLLLTFLVLSCSRPPQAQNLTRFIPLDPDKPLFMVVAGDLSAPAVLGTNASPTGAHATIVVRVAFNARASERFQEFTRYHTNQQIQFMVGSNVVAEPLIRTEIPHGKVEIDFSSLNEAKHVRDTLNGK